MDKIQEPEAPGIMGTYLTWSEAFGQPLPPADFVDMFRTWSWREVLTQIAIFGAVLANRHRDAAGPVAERMIRIPIERDPSLTQLGWRPAMKYIANNPDRPLVHEQVIYLLAAMAILYGGDAGPHPSPENWALMFLAGNDCLYRWLKPDSRVLSREQQLAAELVHLARFNTFPDSLRDLARVSLIFSRSPSKGPLSHGDVWSNIQKIAFGESFEKFFSRFVMAVQFETQRWGAESDGRLVAPIIDPDIWYSKTLVPVEAGEAFIGPLTITREEAQVELLASVVDGIPHAPTLFIKKPFVRLSGQRVLAISPWVVREQLRGGIYAGFARAVNARFDKEVWPSAFGNLFELYCRYVAKIASSSTDFRGKVVLSRAPGTVDEIEDVVVVEGQGCILGSVKSRLVKESVARQARSRTELLDWYEDFLFGPAKGRYQAGALRLLDRKVKNLRSGKYGRQHTYSVIAPVLISFDDLADNVMLSRWIAERCNQERLLCQRGVLPVVLAPVDELEVLLALAAKGMSPLELLTKFCLDRQNHSNLNGFLHSVRAGDVARLGVLEDEFKTIAERTRRELFVG